MSVYRNLQVDIPKSNVTIEKQKNGKPALIKYVIDAPYNREKGYAEPRRTTIGHQCLDSTTKMHPTTQYKNIFPKKWEALTQEKVTPMVKKIGLFTIAQAVNEKTGIKDALDSVYGDKVANALYEQALYSILYHSDVTSSFEQKMIGEMLYSSCPLSDSYYSNLYAYHMSPEQEIQFKDLWAKDCIAAGAQNVWLCIDGSNDDCQSKGVDLAEKGLAKSRHNSDIISFTYAVTTDGLPVAYETYQGSLVDFKAMKVVIDHLRESDFHLKGVILDRGYCNSDVLQHLHDEGIPYIIMIKGRPAQNSEFWQTYGNTIKMNMDYLIPKTHLFGIQKELSLYKNCDWKDYITLYFDYQNAAERITALLDNVYKVQNWAEAMIAKGKETETDDKYYEYIEIDNSGDAPTVKLNTSGLQTAVDSKGLYSIACSLPLTPYEIHNLYKARNAAEVQFRTMKTQLGYGTARVQTTASVKAEFLIGFIAAVVRHELEEAAADTGRTTDQMIHEADKLEAQKINEIYTYTHTESERLKSFFSKLGVETPQELIDETITYENDRLNGRVPTPRKRKTGMPKGSHRKKRDENGKVISNKPGVKAGTKRGLLNKDGSLRKKPGVPKGTKRTAFNKDGSLRKKPGPKSH